MELNTLLLGLSWLYAIANTALAIFGLNLFYLLGLAIYHWRASLSSPALLVNEWPTVLVQLPVYNERYVIERLIDAAAALDYPPDRLRIQVLDDSTDDTTDKAAARVAYHRARGTPIEYLHRQARTGYKAGALAEGMAAAPGEFMAVFDADFIPPPDFLRRMIPHFNEYPRIGMVQARWGYLNAEQTIITRAIALATDNIFAVDHVARGGAGLLLNFNGSAGILRRACVEEAGGWSADTLVEDFDLSYRAQIAGWRIRYCSDIVVPSELPASVLALKQQQFRWVKGSIQVVRKLTGPLLRSRLSPLQKVQGLLHLAGYFPSLLMVFSLLFSLPVVLLHGQTPIHWSLLGVAMLAPPLAIIWGQSRLRHDWHISWLNYPALFLLGLGLSVSNTSAIVSAFYGRKNVFVRTPKFAGADLRKNAYALSVDWSAWVELLLAIYGFGTGYLALFMAPALAPFIFMYALGFGFTAVLGFWQSGRVHFSKKQQKD